MGRGLHIVWIHEHATMEGGAERYIAGTARLLRERGVRSTLLYSVASSPAPRMRAGFDGVYPVVRLADQLAELAADVVFLHRPASAEMLATLAAECPERVACFFHDHHLFCLRRHKYTTLGQQTCTRRTGLACYPCLGFVNRSESWPGVRLRSLAALHAEQRQTARFAAFVVASRYMAEHVAAHGFARERIHVAPLSSPLPRARPREEREAGRLLFVGALNRGKGVDVLLRALRLARGGPRLWLVGRGRQEEELRLLSRTLGLEDRVEFVGQIEPEVLASYYARCTALVLPSREPETFGLVGVEALSREVPVIASSVGGITEWLHHDHTGLAVPPNDPQALAAAIERMVGDPALAARLGSAGVRLHRERFLPEHHIDRLQEILESVAGGQR